MNCYACGEEMLSCGIPGVFACRNSHILDGERRLGCECRYCMSRPPMARLYSALQETGLQARGAAIPHVFLHGEPGYGEGI